MAPRSGIYCILNIRNNKRYIGSATDARRRIYQHKWMLRADRHDSPRLQGAWNRDGEASFVFNVIEYCSKQDLLRREQYWIDVHRSSDRCFGYNIAKVAGSRVGVPQPAGHAEQIRLLHLGKPKTPEHREKLRQAALRRWQDKTERERQASRFFGKQKSDRRKLSDEQIVELRAMRASGATYVELQRKFGRSPDSINKIIHGINYRESSV